MRWKSARGRFRHRMAIGAGVVLLTAAPAAVSVGMSSTVSIASTAEEAASGPAGSRAAERPPEGRWVTLVTGDRVLVADRGDGGGHQGDEVTMVRPGPGRTGMAFKRYVDAGDTYVVPMDAMSLIGRKLVDKRLFDVSGLIQAGLDDNHRSDLPLIISGEGTSRSDMTAVRGKVAAVRQAKLTRELASVAGVAVRQGKADAATFWGTVKGGSGRITRSADRLTPGMTKIWLDGPVRATLDKSVPQIGAPEAWRAGHTGNGATVAVLDSGIDETHPDLADAVVAAKDFTGGTTGVKDGLGHGTHVASIITGSGAAAGGKYVGVAPDAKLLIGKVLNDFGFGSESDIIAGMEWAVAEHAPVVNLSLGDFFAGDGTGVMDQAVDRLTAETGTLFVAPAGNRGPDAQSVGSPGSADGALTVGAVDDADDLADFSSRGPRWGRFAVKPDLTAPGVNILAARAEGTTLGESVDQYYTEMSGTSMAAPHVAGAAAILAGEHRDWKADRLKAALMETARPNATATIYQQGAGRLDVARADSQSVHATPPVINDGVMMWPHADDRPVSTPVGYHNDGTTPITLDLALDVKDPSGTPAVDGMFTVSPKQVTIPAGGDANATVTVDTTGPGRDGVYGGALIATGDSGKTIVRTMVGINKEVESYNVTLNATDYDGAATGDYLASFTNLDEKLVYFPYDPTGTVTVRLPKGSYFFEAGVASSDTVQGTAMAEPTFVVTGDRSIDLDARRGKPFGATVDRREAKSGGSSDMSLFRSTAYGVVIEIVFSSNNFDTFRIRPSTTTAPLGQFSFHVRTQLARPDPNGRPGSFAGPYLYHVHWWQDGRVPRQLFRHIANKDLAVVKSVHATTSAGATGLRDNMVTMPLPGPLTEFYTPDEPWSSSLVEDGTRAQIRPPRTFRSGKIYHERWNSAVFGPVDPTSLPSSPLADRTGDSLTFDIPLHSDQANNDLGFSLTDSGSTTLYRDGQKVGESTDPGFGSFAVPQDAASYRIETNATRSVSDLSTQVTAVYQFTSNHVAARTPLPLMGIRLAPHLDDHNRAPSGRTFTFPVHVGRQAGAAPYGRLNELTLDVSFDDGGTWRPVRLAGSGDDRIAVVAHPSGAGYVSLRAKAGDTAGNGFEETIVHAYALT
jgi:subtilisin family serine protease